jgi:uncharacterized protein YndB with AHSA1/START domain
MAESEFVYVTYIRTTPEKLWRAMTEPEFTRQFWFGITQESDWKPGGSWCMKFEDGRVADAGEVVESEPPRRLVLKWRHELRPELKAEGFSRMIYELEEKGDVVKFTVRHEIETPHSKFIEAVSGGWPMILSSLKSFLETGEALNAIAQLPKEK